MLTAARITELAAWEGAKTIAVQNFLGTLGPPGAGMTEEEAIQNLILDARSYRWNTITVRAIEQGIRESFRNRG